VSHAVKWILRVEPKRGEPAVYLMLLHLLVASVRFLHDLRREESASQLGDDFEGRNTREKLLVNHLFVPSSV